MSHHLRLHVKVISCGILHKDSRKAVSLLKLNNFLKEYAVFAGGIRGEGRHVPVSELHVKFISRSVLPKDSRNVVGFPKFIHFLQRQKEGATVFSWRVSRRMRTCHRLRIACTVHPKHMDSINMTSMLKFMHFHKLGATLFSGANAARSETCHSLIIIASKVHLLLSFAEAFQKCGWVFKITQFPLGKRATAFSGRNSRRKTCHRLRVACKGHLLLSFARGFQKCG